jgi:hypothetical protein
MSDEAIRKWTKVTGRATGRTKYLLSSRAVSDHDKGDVLARIWAAWSEKPDLRLGQLILNAAGEAETTDIFYTEDYDLLGMIERYAKGEKT